MKKVVLLFGGKSPEHEVSILSATNVFNAIDTTTFDVSLVYVDKSGVFFHVDTIEGGDRNQAPLNHDYWKTIDVVFPVMHGPNCEDGSMQGFLEIMQVPYVGPHVLGSALGMDKDVQKQLLRHNGIAVTDWIAVRDFEYTNKKSEVSTRISEDFTYPVFVKPANMGSSVGVTKVHNEAELDKAIQDAFAYDQKIILERAVEGREIECAVLGTGAELIVSGAGEVISQGTHEFYDYEAKYTDSTGSYTSIPARDISPQKLLEFQGIARRVFIILECTGLSRIDFFLQSDGMILVNEINTIPGFTNMSMYPKLMEAWGVSYRDLITRLIEHALK